MSDTSKPPPDLLTMPNEILTEICSHSQDETYFRGKDWLRTVRLTCEQLHIPATVESGKRFLEDPFVMISRYSLEALRDICAHPLHGPRVHTVRLDAYRLNDWNPSELYKEIANAVLARDNDRMEAAGHKLPEQLKIYGEEYDLVDSGRAEDLLVEALKSVKQYNKPVSIALIGTDVEMAIGYLRRWENKYKFQMKTTFRMLVSAAQRSQCKINKFSCRIPPEYEGMAQAVDTNPEIDIAEVATSSGIFADLKGVQLEVLDYIHSFTTGLSGVLKLAAKIPDLELSTRVGDDGTYWAQESYEVTEAMLRSACCGSLKRLRLSSLVLKPGALKNFLLKHRHTLKKVLFDFVILVGPWDEILRWIFDNLDLQILSLSNCTACLCASTKTSISARELCTIGLRPPVGLARRTFDVVWISCSRTRDKKTRRLMRKSSEIESVGNGNKIEKCDTNGHFSSAEKKNDKVVKRRKRVISRENQERPRT